MLPHLHNGWQVDQAILSEEDKVVVIRFGHDWDPTCMKMDEVLYKVAEKVKNFAVLYLVDVTETPDFNKMFVTMIKNRIFDRVFSLCLGTNCTIPVQ